MVALAGMSTSAGSTKTSEVLQLPVGEEAADFALMGAATLVVRDFATTDGEELDLQGPARHVAVVFAESSEWVEVAVMTADEAVTAYTLIGAPLGGLALQVVKLGIREVNPLRPEVDLIDLAVAVVRERFEEVGSVAAIGTVKWHREDSSWQAASLQRSEAGDWQVVGPETNTDDSAEVMTVTASTVWQEWAGRLRQGAQ
ncbi:hypothetical protein [Aeromicrobium sp.]|uniref:hypothetical protein n=1 Tax=Aeromicrobium sp. TaxID=1871063 RepID=UPI0039E297E3